MRVGEELKTYLQVIWHYKWMIATCAMIASIVALGISILLVPLYSATATLRVASAPGGTADYTYISTATRLSNTYVKIATNEISLNEIVKRLGLRKKPDVEVEVMPETELITISAFDPNPALARDIANTLANLMVEQSMQLYGGSGPTARVIYEEQLQRAKADLDAVVVEYDNAIRTAQASETRQASGIVYSDPDVELLSQLVSVRQQIYGDLLQRYEAARTSEELRTNFITIAQPANIPQNPAAPILPLNAALGLVGGLATGMILAFLFEGMDGTLRGVEDVHAETDLPILCMVPELKQNDRVSKGDRPPAPAFDQLSARVLLLDELPKSATFLITSPEGGAGRSTVAANLAVSLAQGGNRVVLVDMDFRRPRQHKNFLLPNLNGLSNFLRGEIQLEAAFQSTSHKGLRVIPIGSSPPNPHVPLDWLTPGKIGNLFELLSKACDYVLIDAPALLTAADSMMLASQTDRVIMVVTRRATERKKLRQTLQQLTELKARVMGIVVNKAHA